MLSLINKIKDEKFLKITSKDFFTNLLMRKFLRNIIDIKYDNIHTFALMPKKVLQYQIFYM